MIPPRAMIAFLAGIALFQAGCAHFADRGRATMAEKESTAGERAYLQEGDLDSAEAHLTLAVKGGSALGAFLLADLLDATGRPEQALPWYVATLDRAGDEAGHETLAIAAAMALVGIRGRLAAPKRHLASLADRLQERGAILPPESWYQLRTLALAYDTMAGRLDKLPGSLRQTGCLTSFEVFGPLGPLTWDAFDRAGRDLADLPEGPPDRIDAAGCSVRAFPGDSTDPGTYRARTTVLLERPAEVSFRLETTAAARVRIGSAVVHESDTRRAWLPAVRWFEASLPAGTLPITIDLAGEYSPPHFSLAALGTDGNPVFAACDPDVLATVLAVPGPAQRGASPGTQRPGHALARLRAASWWSDHELAAKILDELPGDNPLLMVEAALLAGSDPSLAGEEGMELAGRLLEDALKAEPRLWQARSHLAMLWGMEDRGPEAMALLTAGIELAPEEPGLHERLAGLALQLDWPLELSRGIAALDGLRPESCESLAWNRVRARRAGDAATSMELARRLVACDARSEALAEELERALRFEEALKERRRLSLLDPLSSGRAMDEARTAAAAGDGERLEHAALRAVELAPASGEARWLLADARLAAGLTQAAIAELERAAAISHLGPDAEGLLEALAGRETLEALRVDGPAIVAHYLHKKPRYETAAVWVLDRAVHVVGDDGSRMELVHTIAGLLTAEAVDDHGELALPYGARLLTARTIKADGRILEPEQVAFKDTISMPDLEPGDFVEAEYVTQHPPSPIYPGGFDTERFYFQDFSTAFHRSEMVLVLPEGMAFLTDPRGKCPAPLERRMGRKRALTWRVGGVLPRRPEPLAPWAEEYLPSIRVVSGARPGALEARLREMLFALERTGRRLDASAREITKGIDPADHDALRRACYRWVMEHVEETQEVFEHPAHMIQRGAGSRVHALLGLLRTLGLEARLALVLPADADQTPSEVPSAALAGRMALLLPGEPGWVSLEQDGAPFGYLPPDLRGRRAILVDDGSRMMTNGGSVAVDSHLVDLTIEIGVDGDARGRVTERMRGILAASWRADLRRLSLRDRADRFQERYLSSTIPGSVLVSLEVTGLEDPEDDLLLEWSFEAPAFTRPVAGGFAAALPFEITLLRRLGGLATRETEAVVASRIAKRVRIEVSLPPGHAAEVSRAPDVAGKWGSATRSIEDRGDRLLIEVDAALDAGRISPKEYPDLVEFARAVDLSSSIALTIRPAP